MMKKFVINVFVTMMLVLMLAAPSFAAFIEFDEYAVGTEISNQYAAQGVVFQAVPNGKLPIISWDYAMTTEPVLSPNPPYAGDFYMIFTGLGATNVSFISGWWDGDGTGDVDVYDPSDNLLASLTNIGTGVYTFNLAAYGTIGKIYFNSISDPAGADIDNLSFNSVPEPATLLLLGLGLAGIASLRRKI